MIKVWYSLLKLKNIIISHVNLYPTPSNLSYFWSFGSLAGFFLILQIVTGLLLTARYLPDVNFAFESVRNIMVEVSGGWFLRYLHANGASFFLVVYLHMFRGIYYRAYLNEGRFVWLSGFIIFVLLIGTAFLGYTLPYGQMSFWAATVITNLLTVLPVIGIDFAQFVWGDFSVGQATLSRFFMLHYLLPFIILALTLLHLNLLHYKGSNQPLQNIVNFHLTTFSPYFLIKDIFGIFFWLLLFLFIVFLYPNILGHSDNYIPANLAVTPTHIVPEWYFLPFYAVLRVIPTKTGGVCLLTLFLSVLALLPWLDKSEYFISNSYQNIEKTGLKISFTRQVHFLNFRHSSFYKIVFFFIVVTFILLGWLGMQPLTYPYYECGQYTLFFYFFLILLWIL